MAIFMGGFYLAIDATAGEREHGSHEPLLAQPVSRVQLVLGKVTATAIFSAEALPISSPMTTVPSTEPSNSAATAPASAPAR